MTATFETRSPWVIHAVLAMLLVLLITLAFGPAIHAGFLWDDDAHLTENPHIVGPLGFGGIWTSSAAVYYPMTLTTFWALHLIWGLNPLPYHFFNIAMHTACAIFLWRVLARLRIRGAWLGAAIWALHPVQVESVAWITELKNTQSCLFYLMAIWFFLTWLDEGVPANRRQTRWAYALALVCAMLGLLSKTSTVMLPVVLGLCWWWWRVGRWRWRNILPLGPFFLLSAAAAAWTIWEQMYHSRASGPEWMQSVPERIVIGGKVVWFYLGKLFWPHPLVFVYPRWTIDATQLMAYLPAVAVTLTLIFLWRFRNSRLRPAFFAFAYFVVSLFPVSGFFSIYFFIFSFVGDHFQYLASIGPLVLLGAGIDAALDSVQSGRWFLKPALCGTLLILPVAMSAKQSTIYANAVALWTDTLSKNPDAWLAHTNLGAEFDVQGRYVAAIAEYRESLRLNPNDVEARNNLGTDLAELGHQEEAIAEWNEVLRIQPDHANAHNNLGSALAEQERFSEAFRHWEKALKANPYLALAHVNFASALAQTNRFGEAIEHYESALQLKPRDAAVHEGLASALTQQHQYGMAIEHYRKALELDPSRPVTNALAWLLATCPDASLRNGREAVEFAWQAVRLPGGIRPENLDTLAAAYAEVGQFDDAIRTAKQALDLPAASRNPLLTDRITDRIKLYETHRPFRISGNGDVD